ncbi:nectin-1-like isoform X1 [Hemitrygon akajei]|uniref:nectin-1-like isoform X1 n=1 Tax=Hemitrygon akajei TaxID=2704970 RepID=UPI003BFA2A75
MLLLCRILFQLTLLGVLGTQVAKVEDFITGIAGDGVRLPCCFISDTRNLNLVQITWLKKAATRDVNLAVYNPQFGISYPDGSNRFSLSNATPTDCTLTINPLQLSDEGLYYCEVNTFPNGKHESKTNLTVLVKPLTELLAVPAAASFSEAPVAHCTAANGKPAAVITWSDRIPGNATFTRMENTNGTVTVLSQYRIIPNRMDDGKNVTCFISHNAFTDAMDLTVALSIRYRPEITIRGYDGNWYVKSSNRSLECLAKANPPVRSYRWTMSTGSLPPTVHVKDNRLFITQIDYSVNGTWICEATNAIGKGRSEITVVVKAMDSRTAVHFTGEPFASTLAYIVVGTLVTVLLIVVSVTITVTKTRRETSVTRKEVKVHPENDREFAVFATLNLKVVDNATSSSKEARNQEATVVADLSAD